MKLGDLDNTQIEEFLKHRNPIIFRDIERNEREEIISFRVDFDDGLTLRIRHPEGNHVESQYVLFVELMEICKKDKNQVIEN